MVVKYKKTDTCTEFEFDKPIDLSWTDNAVNFYTKRIEQCSPFLEHTSYVRKKSGITDEEIMGLVYEVMRTHLDKYVKGAYRMGAVDVNEQLGYLSLLSDSLGSRLDIEVRSPQSFLPHHKRPTITKGRIKGYTFLFDAQVKMKDAATAVLYSLLRGKPFEFKDDYVMPELFMENEKFYLQIGDPTAHRLAKVRQYVDSIDVEKLKPIIRDAWRLGRVFFGMRLLKKHYEHVHSLAKLAQEIDSSFPLLAEYSEIERRLKAMERWETPKLQSRLDKIVCDPRLRKYLVNSS